MHATGLWLSELTHAWEDWCRARFWVSLAGMWPTDVETDNITGFEARDQASPRHSSHRPVNVPECL